MPLHDSKRRRWHLIFASAVICSLTQFCLHGQAAAQVLTQQVNQLLANGCQALGTLTRDVNGTPTELGPQLAGLCAFPSTPTSASTGGGAASVQGSAASILNRVLLQRMYETDEEEGQVPTRSSSMKFNPLGSLLSGFGRTSSVSSPFYAATTAGGGSTATFTSGSQRRWNGLGFFASGLVESLNRDITTFQDGYKSNILGITGGADYRFSKKLVAGLALSYSNTDGDFRSGGGV